LPLLLFETMVFLTVVLTVPAPVCWVKMPPPEIDAVLLSIVTLMSWTSRTPDVAKL